MSRLFVRLCLLSLMLGIISSSVRHQQAAGYGMSDVTATLDPDEPFATGMSLLWSPTGQAAWDQMKEYHGVKAVELEPHSHLADVMNHFVWNPAAVLPDGTVIFGGDDSEQRRMEIRETLRKRIGAQAAAMIGHYLPPGPLSDGTTRLGSALFVSCLSHHPKFPAVFTPSPSTFKFSNGRSITVKGLGCEGAAAAGYSDAVQILADDFKGAVVMKFKLFNGEKGRPEHMLVAMRPGMTSLGEAITWMRETVKNPLPADQAVSHNGRWWRWHHELTPGDKLWLPLLQTSLACEYGELVGRTYLRQPIENGGLTFWRIREAQQLLSFRLDEQGALAQAVFKIPVDSLSAGGGEIGEARPPEPKKPPLLPRRFIFKSPFVVSLWIKGADWPYLACWVDSEALVQKN